MAAETTDPLEQAVMEAADEYAKACASDDDHPWGYAFSIVSSITLKERLRLHVQLALAKAYRDGLDAANRTSAYWQIINKLTASHTEIAALDARLQEE